MTEPIEYCGRCWPSRKPARIYYLQEPLPKDCPLPTELRFGAAARGYGAYVMCDDCAKEGARWFVSEVEVVHADNEWICLEMRKGCEG
jgi:hypothetical protein